MIAESRRSALFFLVAFVQALDNQIVPLLLPFLRREMPGAPVGQLLTAYALACGTVPFLATTWGRADKFKILSISAIFALALAAFAFAAVPDLPVRLAARATAGAASGMLSMTVLLSAARTEDARTRARHFTVYNAGYLSALVLGVPLSAQLVKLSDGRLGPLYLVIGALALALVVPFARSEGPRPAVHPARTGSFIRLFRGRQAALILIASGVVGAAMASPVAYLASYLTSVRHLGIDAVGAVYMWAGVGPLLAMPIAGRTIVRFEPHVVAIAGSLVIAAPIFAFPQLATSLATAAAVMLVCVFIETIRRAALQGSLADAVPSSDLPRYLAFRGVMVQIGQAAGYALGEIQFDSGGFELVCRVAAILSASAAGILFAARPASPPAAA
jgi:predicted MFS family arabinose efflux permease